MNRVSKYMQVPSFLLLLLCFADAKAAYHVAANGNDISGDGTTGNPWATITKALDSVPDGALILVHSGTYYGSVRIRGSFTQAVTVRSEPLYQAMLRHSGTVITSYDDNVRGITLEGFDIAHSGDGAGALVVHIDGGGSNQVSEITLRNNILHDSYNNDILKINNAATDIVVEGNVFYNQTGSDEHIDINSVDQVTVQDNIFFNDFEGSGRSNGNDTSSYIVIKDSNGDDDAFVGSRNVTVRRNIFLNWEGSTGSNFVLVGEDGKSYFEGVNIVVENNLMLGNSSNVMRAPFGVKGGQNVTFRHNTVSGNLPSFAYGMRLNREGSNPANLNIQFYNNIWADQTGTMGANSFTGATDFSDTPPADTASFYLNNNIYWNAGSPIPNDPSELINYTDDIDAVVANPLLPEPLGVTLPRWDHTSQRFGDGSATIREAFTKLVAGYCSLSENSVAVDSANDSQSPQQDILGNQRPYGEGSDVGACEYNPQTGGDSEGGQAVPFLHLLLQD